MAARQIYIGGAMPSRDENGRALPAKLRFYTPDAAFSTPKTVYADEALTVPHPFPLVSDGGGRWPQIWATDTEVYDVAWSRLDTDAAIGGPFFNIKPLSDALIASADLAQQAALAADGFADDAEASSLAAAATAAGIGDVLADAQVYVDQAEEYRDQALQYRNEAEAIVGFDPTNYVTVASPQSYNDTQKAQARSNIGAAPLASPSFTGPVASAGALTVAGLFTANGGASVASGLTVAGGETLTGGLTQTGSTKSSVTAVGALSLDLAANDVFTKSISSNSAFTFANATSGKHQAFLLYLTISSSAVPSWPASVVNPIGGLVNGLNVLGFSSPDGGTTWVMYVGAKVPA